MTLCVNHFKIQKPVNMYLAMATCQTEKISTRWLDGFPNFLAVNLELSGTT